MPKLLLCRARIASPLLPHSPTTPLCSSSHLSSWRWRWEPGLHLLNNVNPINSTSSLNRELLLATEILKSLLDLTELTLSLRSLFALHLRRVLLRRGQLMVWIRSTLPIVLLAFLSGALVCDVLVWILFYRGITKLRLQFLLPLWFLSLMLLRFLFLCDSFSFSVSPFVCFKQFRVFYLLLIFG